MIHLALLTYWSSQHCATTRSALSQDKQRWLLQLATDTAEAPPSQVWPRLRTLWRGLEPPVRRPLPQLLDPAGRL
eukprot:12896876-Prorocentrum_lima.AAC.1